MTHSEFSSFFYLCVSSETSPWYKRINTYKCILFMLCGNFILITLLLVCRGSWESGNEFHESDEGTSNVFFTAYFINICGIFITMTVSGWKKYKSVKLMNADLGICPPDFEESAVQYPDFQRNIIITQQRDLQKLALDLA